MTRANGDEIEFRPATDDDYEAVVAFTEDTWDELDVETSDYLPDIYHEFIAGENNLTIVADAGDAIAGIGQFVMLSEYEGWVQGMRVNPDYRGQGVASGINDVLFEWGRDQGAVVVRNMVFSWNEAGLGQSRANGFEPVTEFRWLNPEPESEAATVDSEADPDQAFAFWSNCDAREHLGGLTLDMDESWAMCDLTREILARAADETALLTVEDSTGTTGLSYRTRTFETETDEGGTVTWAEYGVGAWTDVDAGRDLLDQIKADAAAAGADRTRVLIPETVRSVSDGAFLRGNISQEPDFVLSLDLAGADL